MESSEPHKTVLLNEAVESLITDPGGFYVDGTFGRGGHSRQILGGLSEGGRLMGIDKDPQAITVGSLLAQQDTRFSIKQGSFSQLEVLLETFGSLSVSGVLLDLGVSSPQLDQADRGFSFLKEGPLDMRMNPESGMSAAEWINTAEESQMAWVFKEYGEERFARRIAKAVVASREQKALTTTTELAKVVAEANPSWEKGKHPATRVFQAIRIYINNELGDLSEGLNKALELLVVGGRLVVISFHSLEDRMVKHFIQQHERGDDLPIGVPVTSDRLNRRLKRVGKVIKPSGEEIESNARARSAVMRVAEKLV